MKSTKEEIQAIKTLLKDSSTAKYHKRLQIVLFRLMGKSYKEIIELLDCNQTTIWRNVKKYEELGLNLIKLRNSNTILYLGFFFNVINYS